jgi:zinc transporter ZupT
VSVGFVVHRKRPSYGDVDDDKTAKHKRQVLMSGLVTAIGIGLHNFPEGVAVFLAAHKCQALGKCVTSRVLRLTGLKP